MIKTHRLENGITVVTELLPHVKSAAFGVWVRAGAVDDGERAGISHFIEHMMFKGTQRRNYSQISYDIEKLGGSINAFTSKESTCYYIKSLSENLAAGIDVLADMVTASSFLEEEIAKEKGVVVEEIKMIDDSPEDFGQDLITEYIFGQSVLANRILGSKESVEALTREDILGYLGERYCGNSTVISCAGMFDEAELIAEVEKGFSRISGKAKDRTYTPGPSAPTKSSAVRDIEQAHIFFGAKGVGSLDDDMRAIDLYAQILGGGMSSRLFAAVREEKGLAYAVYAGDSSFVNDGQFVIYAGVAQDKIQVASEAIAEEIEKLASERVTDEELSKVKEQFKGSFVFRQESNSSRMIQSGHDALLLGRTRTQDEIIKRVDAVTAEDILRIGKRYADFSSYSALVVAGKEVDASKLFV
ncbi:MAG: insulinase family protein [Clostridiales Family XIII bacterium]|nr:insulinase family protein [Clostridiales Family XIII bacterium]